MTSSNLEKTETPETSVKCPACGNDVTYRYGHAYSGKQKYLCVMCNHQFVLDNGRCEFRERPVCPKCGNTMHVYMQSVTCVRFRCSTYPKCREFVKVTKEN